MKGTYTWRENAPEGNMHMEQHTHKETYTRRDIHVRARANKKDMRMEGTFTKRDMLTNGHLY